MEELKKRFNALERLTLLMIIGILLTLSVITIMTKSQVYQKQKELHSLQQLTKEIEIENKIIQKKIDLRQELLEKIAERYGLQQSYDRVRNIR